MKKVIIKTIEQITRRYGTDDPQRLCDALGIPIVKTRLEGSVKGFFMSVAGKRIIVVNDELDAVAENYCIAHELGHSLLHENLNLAFLSSTLLSVGRYEREADLFAAYLILGQPSKEKLYEKNLFELSSRVRLPIEIITEWAKSAA